LTRAWVYDTENARTPLFFRKILTTRCCQIIGETVGKVMPVEGMHQRKAEMARQSDAFIALPGE